MSLSLWDTMDLINKTTLNAKIAEMKKAAFLAGSALVNDAGGNVVLPVGNLPTIPASKVSGLSAEATLGSCVTGTYNADGEPRRLINIGFRPQLVFVWVTGLFDYGLICIKTSAISSLFTLVDRPINSPVCGDNTKCLTDSAGFYVGVLDRGIWGETTNTYGFLYYYVAIGRA